MNILVATFSDEEPAQETPRNPLQDGFICEGSPSGMTGDGLWYDTSTGEAYGGGNRYDCEETPFMTRVASKHK